MEAAASPDRRCRTVTRRDGRHLVTLKTLIIINVDGWLSGVSTEMGLDRQGCDYPV